MSLYRRDLGARGEAVAEAHLRRHGYTIVERNYRCPLGEVDLIALHRSTIVFVEVKARDSGAEMNPLEAVDRRKQQRIARAAQHYLRRHRLLEREARFDVVGVTWYGEEPEIDLVCNAFDAPKRRTRLRF